MLATAESLVNSRFQQKWARDMARIPSWDSHMSRSIRKSLFYIPSMLFSKRRASFDEPIFSFSAWSSPFSGLRKPASVSSSLVPKGWVCKKIHFGAIMSIKIAYYIKYVERHYKFLWIRHIGGCEQYAAQQQQRLYIVQSREMRDCPNVLWVRELSMLSWLAGGL